MHECPKTHFKHKCMHASHHATLSCHITIPHHHAMSSCHISMPCHHTTSSCHVSMPHHHDTLSFHVIRMHFLTTTWHLEGVPCGTSSKIFPIGAKLQNTIYFASEVRLRHRWNQLDELFEMVLFLLQYDDFENWPF